MKHRTSLVSVRFIVSTALISLVAFVLGTYRRQFFSISHNAYTIQYVSTATADGYPTTQTRKFIARRSDGSRVEGFVVDGVSGSQATITKTIYLTGTGIKIFDHGLSGSVSTTPIPESRIQLLRRGPSDPSCVTDPLLSAQRTYLGNTEYLGFRVVRLETVYPKLGKNEIWEAPDLNCEILYSHLQLKEPPPYRAVTQNVELKATSVRKGEPNSDLFASPSTYKERSPSEIVRMAATKQGVPLADETASRLPSLDKDYERNRVTAAAPNRQ